MPHEPSLLKQVQAVGPLWGAPPNMDGGVPMVDGQQMGTHGHHIHHDARLPPGLHNNVQFQPASLMVGYLLSPKRYQTRPLSIAAASLKLIRELR